MARMIEYKLRVASDEAVFLAVFLVDTKAKAIKDAAALAGNQPEIVDYDITAEGYREMVAWIKTQLFANKMDEARTMDIQRFTQKLSRNVDSQILLADAINSGDLENLHYALQIDLEIATGTHDLRLLSHYADYVEQAQVEQEKQDDRLQGRIPLSFVISPFAGVPLMRLDIGAKVLVRPVEPEKEPARSYLRSLGLNLKDTRMELKAVLRSIETVRGTDEVLALIDLPGNAKAFVREDELTLRVKLVNSDAKTRKRTTVKVPTHSLFDNPLVTYGIVAGLIILAMAMFYILL